MIKFSCKNCGQKLNVEDKHSGKRVKCPKCGSVGVVPDNSDKIKFHCDSCGQSISVPQIHAGKKGRCPKCKNPVIIPSVKKEPTDDTKTFSIVCSMCEEAIQVPEASRGQAIECPACSSYIETTSEGGPPDSTESESSVPSGADEYQYEEDYDVSEEDTGVDRRLILAISGVATIVVLGLIILVTVILPSGSKQVKELAVPLRQEVGNTDLRPQPVTSETHPIGPTVQKSPIEKTLPEVPVSSDRELFRETKIAFASDRDGNWEIYVMDMDGSGQRNLTNNPAPDSSPSWSPASEKIAFSSQRDRNGDIYVMNADGSGLERLTNDSAADGSPSWSLDGKKITFWSERDGNREIYIMNADGKEQKRLTNSPAVDDQPCWSSDGKKIAFTSERDGNREIYVTNLDGSGLKRLTNNPDSDSSPCWSSDGENIAFSSRRNGNLEIYVMNPDGSEQKKLTNNPAMDGSPSWSPDGEKITFVSFGDGNPEIYVMNADGSEPRRLTNNPASDSFPSWSPFLASRSRPVDEPKGQMERPEITDKDVQSRVVSSEQSVTNQNLNLKLRLKVGQKHRLRLYREYDISLTIRGQRHDSGDIHTEELEFEVEQVDANNVTSLKVTYLRISAIHKTAQEQSEYDSAKPETVVNSSFGPIFSAMIGRSFVVKVTSEGKIVKLEGLAEMYQQMAEPLVEYEDEVIRQRYAGSEEDEIRQKIGHEKYGSRDKRIEAAKEGLDKSPYSREEDIRDMLDNVIMYFPGGPVAIGDSWTSAPFSMGGLELGNYTYTLSQANQAAILLDASLKIDVDKEVPALVDGSRGSSRTTLTGSGKGTVEIDPNTGWMLRKNMTLRYSGDTKTAPTKQNPRGRTATQSMENITTVEPIE